MKSKKERLTEIAAELMELYPELDGVIVEGTMDEPVRIVFMSTKALEELAEEYDFDVEEMYGEPELLGWDDDDDDGEGFIQ